MSVDEEGDYLEGQGYGRTFPTLHAGGEHETGARQPTAPHLDNYREPHTDHSSPILNRPDAHGYSSGLDHHKKDNLHKAVITSTPSTPAHNGGKVDDSAKSVSVQSKGLDKKDSARKPMPSYIPTANTYRKGLNVSSPPGVESAKSASVPPKPASKWGIPHCLAADVPHCGVNFNTRCPTQPLKPADERPNQDVVATPETPEARSKDTTKSPMITRSQTHQADK